MKIIHLTFSRIMVHLLPIFLTGLWALMSCWRILSHTHTHAICKCKIKFWEFFLKKKKNKLKTREISKKAPRSKEQFVCFFCF